ncbi:MAG: hypothetical protein ACJ796_06325 [Gemmatimonadaceae bacterium]
MRGRSLAACIAVVALWIVVACLDVSSPVTGVASITSVILPTPSIVVHDQMRDTLGVVQRLNVYAFAPNGDTIPQSDIIVRYTVLDSTHNLFVDSITGFARSDSTFPTPLAKVVAVVTPAKGKGVIQTVQVPVPIVPKPDSGHRSDDTTFVFNPTGTPSDSLNLNLVSPPLNVTVYSTTKDTTVQSYIVSYQIVRAPASNGNGPTVVFYNPSGNDSTIAVTNTNGVATRQLRIRPGAIASTALLTGAATDTINVFVRVLYHGKPIPIAKDSLFIVPVRAQIF